MINPRITLEGEQMKTLRAGIITVAGAILLVTAVEQAMSPVEASQVLPAATEVAGKTDPELIGISCLPSTPLSCADMPSTYNSTCSCSSTLQPVRCKSCDGGKGQVLQTTCTVSFTCTSEPCDIQQNITRSAVSCAT